MTFVRSLLFAIGIFNLLITFWIGCAFFSQHLKVPESKKYENDRGTAATSQVEDGLG
jgi:hypothetical protein